MNLLDHLPSGPWRASRAEHGVILADIEGEPVVLARVPDLFEDRAFAVAMAISVLPVMIDVLRGLTGTHPDYPDGIPHDEVVGAARVVLASFDVTAEDLL